MRYLYYKVYQNFKAGNINPTPAFNAMIFMGMLQGMNIFSICIVINHFVKFSLYDSIMGSKYQTLVFSLIVFTADYFLLFKNQKEISERYKNESKGKSKRGNILAILYLVGSVALVVTVGKFL